MIAIILFLAPRLHGLTNVLPQIFWATCINIEPPHGETYSNCFTFQTHFLFNKCPWGGAPAGSAWGNLFFLLFKKTCCLTSVIKQWGKILLYYSETFFCLTASLENNNTFGVTWKLFGCFKKNTSGWFCGKKIGWVAYVNKWLGGKFEILKIFAVRKKTPSRICIKNDANDGVFRRGFVF